MERVGDPSDEWAAWMGFAAGTRGGTGVCWESTNAVDFEVATERPIPLPRFRIRTLMIAVAVVAAACTWPDFFVFAASIALGAAISLSAVFTTAGRQVVESRAVAIVFLTACVLVLLLLD